MMENENLENIEMFAHFIFFYSLLISFKKFSCNFNEDILCLTSVFVGSVTGFGSAAGSGVDSRIGILSNFLLKIICF